MKKNSLRITPIYDLVSELEEAAIKQEKEECQRIFKELQKLFLKQSQSQPLAKEQHNQQKELHETNDEELADKAKCKGLIEKMKDVSDKSEDDFNYKHNKSQNAGISGEEKSLKLLIVEDDAINRMVMEKFAIRKGWKVIMAEDGKAALDAYQKQEIDVIIMDCQMPVLDGYQTTGAIRQLESQRGTHTPIIAMTANALPGDRATCLNAGMDDYLTKPIETKAFYEMVERWAIN